MACGVHVIMSCCTCVLQEYMKFYSSCSLLFSLSLSLSVGKGNLACRLLCLLLLLNERHCDEMGLSWYEI